MAISRIRISPATGSALGRRLDGIRRMRRNNLGRVLIVVMRPVLQPSRTHLIHSPAKDALFHRPVEPYGVILSRSLCDLLRVRPSPTWSRFGRRPRWAGQGCRRSARRDLPLTGPPRAPAGCNGRAHDQAALGMMACRVRRNSVRSRHMRYMITASRQANATMAFCRSRRLATFIAHALSHDHFVTRVSSVCAAS